MPSIVNNIIVLITLRLLLVVFALSLPGCSLAPIQGDPLSQLSLMDAGDAGDAGEDSNLPQCSPLGGPSGQYCNTTDNGKCMTTVCNCTDSLGHPIAALVYPMVGFDAGDCAAP